MKRKFWNLIRLAIRSLITWAALPKPGRLTPTLTREDNAMLIYTAGFPTIETADVVSQDLTVNVDGVETTESYARDATVSNEFSAADNATVTLTLIYIDDAGNHSEPRVQSFTATDTIAPAAPGEMTVNLVREE